jgi:hypothetical protein
MMQSSKIQCPKCKCRNLMLIEVWRNHTIEWQQIDGRFDRDDGVLEHGENSQYDPKRHADNRREG